MNKVIKIDKSTNHNLDDDWRQRLRFVGETTVPKGLPWREFRYKSASGDKEYYVAIRKSKEDEVIGSCTCPYGARKTENPCKHLSAAFLYCEENGYGELIEEISLLQEIEDKKNEEKSENMPEEDQNKRFWNQFNQPPAGALKLITAGRLKNMFDINPQWRYKVLTEVFGPCGDGWKFTIDSLWLEPGANDAIFAFAKISLFVKLDGEWSDAIPGVGGSMLIADEARGPHNNDEAYKMSVTDAIGAAAKMIGVGADIYMGLWDGTKYKEQTDETRVLDWLALCEEAASNQSVDEYRQWWSDNKEQIKEDCGDSGAAKIYKRFTEIGRKMAGE